MKTTVSTCLPSRLPVEAVRPAVPYTGGRRAFTLIEVMLAVGVLAISVLALLGLFGPTVSAVKGVVDRSGALAVADQLNAELLSRSIYKVFGTENNPDNFQLFAAALPAASSSSPMILYAWRERSVNSRADLDVTTLRVQLSPTKPSGDSLTRIEGGVYLVLLSQGLDQGTAPGKFDWSNIANKTYFPVGVSIYELSGTDLTGSGHPTLTPYLDGSKGRPLFQYTGVMRR